MSERLPVGAEPSLGDPRVARSRERVRQAAAALLAEVGFGGVSIEAVARRSGVAKTTIYRHWPSLGELLVETLDGLMAADLVGTLGAPSAAGTASTAGTAGTASTAGTAGAPGTVGAPGTAGAPGAAGPTVARAEPVDDPLVRIRAHVDKLGAMARGPNARLVLSFLAAAADDPAVAALHDRFVAERRWPLIQALTELADAGRLRQGAVVDELADMLAGPIFTRWLVSRLAVTEAFVHSTVDAALRAWLVPTQKPPARGRGRGGR